MGALQTQGICSTCNGSRLFTKREFNSVPYILITIFSCGWGVIPWLIMRANWNSEPFRCSQCGGTERVPPVKETSEPSGKIKDFLPATPRSTPRSKYIARFAVFGVLAFAYLFIRGAMMSDRPRNVPAPIAAVSLTIPDAIKNAEWQLVQYTLYREYRWNSMNMRFLVNFAAPF